MTNIVNMPMAKIIRAIERMQEYELTCPTCGRLSWTKSKAKVHCGNCLMERAGIAEMRPTCAGMTD
jgi:hypothetical protein